jgi:FAD/FMN-containing dehydrogenase
MSQTFPQLSELQTKLQGRVIGPTDTDYNQLRTVFYGGIDRKPAIIVLAANSQDVQVTVNLARETGLELAIRSGGHSFAGYSVCEGGIVLDLRNMNHHDIDAAAETAWVEPGLTAGQFTQAADQHDLVLGFGDTGSVGVGGITVGGGVGFLARKTWFNHR